MKYFKVFMLCALATASCFYVNAQRKLLILGSSTSACTGPSVPDSCYVNRLQKYFQDRGTPIIVDNRAVGSYNVYRGMPTTYTPPPGRDAPQPYFNITDGLAANPDVVLVNYPSNGYDVFSLTEVMFCLRTIRQTAQNAGRLCFITTTQPRESPASFNDPVVRRRMSDLKDSILTEFGSFAIDFYTGLADPADSSIAEQYNADGIHLNDAGHRVLFERVVANNIFTSILPVRFNGFTAAFKNSEVEIQWTTESEQNIHSYHIERSEDGIQFATIGKVPANNSLSLNKYVYIDKVAHNSLAYYRITAINGDGKAEYSRVIRLLNNKQPFAIRKVFVTGLSVVAELQATESQMIRIQLVNHSGQVLATTLSAVNAGITPVPLAVSGLKKGVYFLRASVNGSGTQVKSFVKE